MTDPTDQAAATVATWTATPQQMERVVAAVLPHAGGDPHLPMLTCVRLEAKADRIIAVATDRYTIGVSWGVCAEWNEDADPVEPVEASVFAADLKRLFAFLKPHKKASATWTLSADALTVSIDDGQESLTVRTVVADFPKWRGFVGGQAAKEPAPAAAIRFTPRMVDHFTQTAKALGEDAGKMVWRIGGANDPALIEFIGANFVGLIMPQRMDEVPVLDLSGIGIESPSAVAA